MSDQVSQSPAPADSPALEPVKKSRIGLIYAIVVMLAAAVGVSWIARQSLDHMDYDYKNVIGFFIVFLASLLVGAWLWWCWRFPLFWKIVIPAAVIGGFFALFRFQDFRGDMSFEIVWRFAPEADELLAASVGEGGRTEASLEQATNQDYPRFLGADGRSTISDVQLKTDWQATPPREVWRQLIGAGWSAFSIVGRYAVTQEQRGENEMVTCYDLETGKLIWAHSDGARFDSFPGGIGPRATPTIDEGRVYTVGATGILNCLDGATGEKIWSHNIVTENDAPQVQWGRSGSPLVVDEMVIVSAGGPNGRSLIAYDKLTGKELWSVGDDRVSYASPELATLGGVRQVLIFNENWLRSHRLEDGEELWSFAWESKSDSEAQVSQPVPLDNRRVFFSSGYGRGGVILEVTTNEAGEFTTNQIDAKKTVLKTKMANVVVHKGHVYGLSGGILECVRLDGLKRAWKASGRKGRYGHGQIMLIGDTILVVSEEGDMALVEATPEKYNELTRIRALNDKTWNNPAMSGRLLLVRNHREAVCYEMPVVE